MVFRRLRWRRRSLLRAMGAAGAASLLAGTRFAAGGRGADYAAEGGAGPGPRSAAGAVAWLAGARPAAATTAPSGLLAFGPDATVVGEIAPLAGSLRRSVDGERFMIAWARPNASKTTSTLIVDLHSAADGGHLRRIEGHTIPLGGPNAQGIDEHDEVTLAPSPDGRFVAIRRWVMHVDPARVVPGKGGGNAATTYTISVGVLDLASERFSDPLELDRGDGRPIFGEVVVAPDGRTLYFFGQGFAVDQTGISGEYVAVLDFDGQRLSVRRRVRDGEGDHRLAPRFHYTLQKEPAVFTDAGQTLIGLGFPEVIWFDLDRLTVAETLATPVQQTAKPVQPATLLAPDRALAYIVNCRFGMIHPVDLARRASLPPVTIPEGPRLPWPYGPGVWPSLDSSQRAALSPTGHRLYLIDNRTNTGVAVVRLPDLSLADRWLIDRLPVRLRPSPDGRTLFVLMDDGELVCLDCATGTIRGSTRLAPRAGRFV